MPTIACEGCDQPFPSPWPNAKLCGACRCLRDLTFMNPDRSKTCTDCGEEFYPIRSSYRRCYTCTDLRAGRRADCHCNVCHKGNKPAPGVTSTCLQCVQASTENRAAYRKALRHRITNLPKEAPASSADGEDR